jgi:SOS regulatory protein LexA
MHKLTEKQKRFYDGLRRLIEKQGESPTVAELVRLMKLSSPRAATQYLESLERKGLIERRRYEHRGIRLRYADGVDGAGGRVPMTVQIPVFGSAGCDNMAVFAHRNLGDYICIATELLQGRKKDNVVCIKAVGDSMLDAGIKEGDHVLVEVVPDEMVGATGMDASDVASGDLVVAIVDSFAVIKKLEFAENAIILRPVSSDPQYKPMILKRDFRIFGKVIDVIRVQPKGELEIVPLYSNPEGEGQRMEYDII